MPNEQNIPNIPLTAALYFSSFTVMFNLMLKYFLFVFKSGEMLPVFSSTLLALLLGAVFGGLFGHRLAAAGTTLRVFAKGTLLAICMIPFYSLGLQLIYYFHHHWSYETLHHWQDYLVLYGVVLLFFTLVAGIWLIPLTGCAALHFNRRFLTSYRAFLQKQHQKSIQAHAHANHKQ